MHKKHDIVEVEVKLRYETKAAYLFDIDNSEPVWVPKSQCDYEDGVVQMAEWLAKDKGML